MNKTEKPVAQAHHLIKFMYLQMIANNMTRNELATGSGVSNTALKRWWKGERNPNLLGVEAVLNFLGYTLKPSPLPEASGARKTARGRRTNHQGYTEE